MRLRRSEEIAAHPVFYLPTTIERLLINSHTEAYPSSRTRISSTDSLFMAWVAAVAATLRRFVSAGLGGSSENFEQRNPSSNLVSSNEGAYLYIYTHIESARVALLNQGRSARTPYLAVRSERPAGAAASEVTSCVCC